jgi:hypothetical protein
MLARRAETSLATTSAHLASIPTSLPANSRARASPHLRVAASQPLEVSPPQVTEQCRLQDPHAQLPRSTGHQTRRPNGCAALEHRKGKLPFRGVFLVDLQLPAEHQHHPLGVLLGNRDEGLARLKGSEGEPRGRVGSPPPV